jgi:hypothetical protein
VTAAVKLPNVAPWGLLLLVWGCLALVWWISMGHLHQDGRHFAPAGQALFLYAKLTGLAALALLLLQWLYAVWKPLLPATWQLSPAGHRYWGGLLALSIMAHVSLFFTAVWLRQQYLPWALLVPDFSQGYYKTGLSLGVLALIGLMVTLYLGIDLALRPGIRVRNWHRRATLLLTPALLHGAMMGSEAEHPLVLALGGTGVALCVVGVGWRLLRRPIRTAY